MLLSIDRGFFMPLFILFFLGAIPVVKGQANRVIDKVERAKIPLLSPYSSKKTSLFKTVDLKPFCPTPQNQENTGTCVSFAVGYGAMSILQALEYQWTDTDTINKYAFSAPFIHNQLTTNPANCKKGIGVRQAIQLLQDKGNCREKMFPFLQDCTTQPTEAALLDARQFKIKRFESETDSFASKTDPVQKIEFLKQALQDSIPIIVNFQNFQCFQNQSKGVAFWVNETERYIGKHTMVVVGMDEETQSFEVMNSWGTDWANDGFVKIDYETFGKHCLDGFIIRPIFESVVPPIQTITKQGAFGTPTDPSNSDIDAVDSNINPLFSDVYYPIDRKYDNHLLDAIPASNGDLLMVVSKTIAADNKNVFIHRIDKNGVLVAEQKLGKLENYQVASLTEDYLGNIILVGNTEGDKGKDSTPWLLRCDRRGGIIEEKKDIRGEVISDTEAIVKQVHFNKKTGKIICFVIRNGLLWVQKYKIDGTWIPNDNEHVSDGDITDLTILPQHNFKVLLVKENYFIYCTAKRPPDIKNPLLIKLDSDGNYVEHVPFQDYHIDGTGGITVLSNGAIGMIGTIHRDNYKDNCKNNFKRNTKENIFYLSVKENLETKTDCLKSIIFYKKSSDADKGIDIVAIDAKTTWLVGNTTSHKRGAQKESLVLFTINKEGTPQKAEPFFWGGNLTEQVKKMILMPDNTIWVVGNQDYLKGLKVKSNLFIGVIRPSKKKSVAINPNAFEITTEMVLDLSSNRLRNQKEGYMKVKLDNKSNLELTGLKIKVTTNKHNLATTFFDKELVVPKIFPGSATYMSIPFEWTDEVQQDMKQAITITVVDANGQLIKTVSSF